MAYTYEQIPDIELKKLIEDCIANKRYAQQRIYYNYFGRMKRMVRRYFEDEQIIEEVVNNGFLRAFKKMELFSFKGSFEGWLRQIVFHAVSEYAKSHIKYKQHVLLVERDEVLHEDFGSNMNYNELLKLIDELPDTNRMVFNMFVFEDKSHKEIAELVGIQPNTSKWYLSDSRKRLMEKIIKKELLT